MTLTLKYAGFNYVADYDGAYTQANSLANMIAETSSNSVALTVDYAIDPQTSTVYGDYNTSTTTGITESLADLTSTIQQAEAAGLSVLVRPLIDFSYNATQAMLVSGNGTVYSDGDWRAYYNPTNVATFFASYQTMIVAEAKAAQAGGAQLFDIGTELDQLTGPQYLSYWTSIISAVRAVFHGQLTYSAISDDSLSPWQWGGTGLAKGTGDITTQVSFWNQLDYVGIDEYAIISNANNGGSNPDPTLAQLIAGWEDVPTDPTTYAMTGGLSLIQYYENVAAKTGKPLLFTELGYESAPDAASQPSGSSSTVYDPTLQANLYKAFFEAWKAQGNTSLQGVYIWNWEPDPGAVGAGSSPNWTPQGNTGALQTVDLAYSEATACYLAGTRVRTDRGEVAVESLRVGDLVVTADGSTLPVRWIGTRDFIIRLVNPHERGTVLPIRIAAGALGEACPVRDLYVSPEHRMCLDGVLIPAEKLLNGRTITRAEHLDVVRYFHVELPRHAVIYAEGAPAESFLDTGNRNMFGNVVSYLELGYAPETLPQAACLPVVTEGTALEAIVARLAGRGASPRTPPGLCPGPAKGQWPLEPWWGVTVTAQKTCSPWSEISRPSRSSSRVTRSPTSRSVATSSAQLVSPLNAIATTTARDCTPNSFAPPT